MESMASRRRQACLLDSTVRDMPHRSRSAQRMLLRGCQPKWALCCLAIPGGRFAGERLLPDLGARESQQPECLPHAESKGTHTPGSPGMVQSLLRLQTSHLAYGCCDVNHLKLPSRTSYCVPYFVPFWLFFHSTCSPAKACGCDAMAGKSSDDHDAGVQMY